MPKPDQGLTRRKPRDSGRAQQMREIEANQEALRRSIAESRRLIEQATAMTRRHKGGRGER